jgi:hypothetical protein
MEELTIAINKSELDNLGPFQKKVWGILNSLFRNLLLDKLSESSVIEKGGLGVDVFLRMEMSDLILYISITEDVLYINSKYIDLYIYPETSVDRIEILLRELLLGNYCVKLGFANKQKLVFIELVFDDLELQEFNQKNKLTLFWRTIVNEERIRGMRLIQGS